MKKILFSISVALIIFSPISCDKESLGESNNDHPVFTARIDNSFGTKTTLTSERKVNWETGDEININGAVYIAEPNPGDATKADFTKKSGDSPSSPYKAIFPASLYVTDHFELPATQTYTAGKFNAPMYAESDDESLSFKNIFSVLKVSVPSNTTVKSIKVSSDLVMNGTFTVDGNVAKMSKTSGISDADKVLTLDCGAGVTGTDFFIAVPAGTYTGKNLRIIVTDSYDKEYIMATVQSAKINITANAIYSFNVNTEECVVYKGDYTIDDYDDVVFLRDGKYTCIDGNLEIITQSASDLDNMITNITGDLTVRNISNFDGLYGLERIGGDLCIEFSSNRTTLLSLEGLNNLESIGGSLDCYYTHCSSSDKNILSGFAESNFEKLNKLKSIGGNLIIKLFSYKPGNLSSLKGLENLSSIGGEIHTEYLSSLEGLSSINEVQSLYIEEASNIDGLKNIKRVNGNATLINGDYESFSGLNNLEYIGGNLTIKASVDVNGTGTVEKFSKITSLAGFDSLREVFGDFIIYSSVDASYGRGYGLNNLTSLQGLNSLQRIGGNLKIMAKGTADGKSSGAGYYSDAYCLNNLVSINIASLQEIGGDLIVDNWHDGDGDGEYYALIKISDFSFSTLKTIGGDITYHYLLYKGAGSYYEREGYSTIAKAPDKLQSVRNINAICAFENESDGFASLETVENLYGNGTGFPRLKYITGNFEITGDSITQIGLMPYLESISNNLTISNTNLTRIQSFNKLSSVGKISIIGNSKLTTVDGFSNLSHCTGITISESPSLFDFDAFVNAVTNGASWSVYSCGYNPTKYQMQHGQSKPSE